RAALRFTRCSTRCAVREPAAERRTLGATWWRGAAICTDRDRGAATRRAGATLRRAENDGRTLGRAETCGRPAGRDIAGRDMAGRGIAGRLIAGWAPAPPPRRCWAAAWSSPARETATTIAA